MQPITGRAGHRADLRAGRRGQQHLPASSDPAADVLEDPLAGLPVDDLSDEDGEDDGQDVGEVDADVVADVVDESGHTVPGRSVLLPLGAAVVLAVVGAVCLLPVRLPWEAPTRPGTVTTAAGPMATSPAGNSDGGAGGRSASSPSPSAPASPAGSSRPALPSAPLDADVTPATPPPASATAGADPDPDPTPEDTLAGPVSDQVLQDLLISSLPPERTITDPALLASPDGQKLLEVAWQALAADVEAGGWTQPRQQAHAVLRTGRDNTQAMPIVVDVVVMWAALDGQGQPIERELSTVRVSKGAGAWAAGKITTASEGN
jgi:hypothetical protein